MNLHVDFDALKSGNSLTDTQQGSGAGGAASGSGAGAGAAGNSGNNSGGKEPEGASGAGSGAASGAPEGQGAGADSGAAAASGGAGASGAGAAGAQEGAAGAAAGSEGGSASGGAPGSATPTDDPLKKMLDELGVKTVDELKEKLKAPETEEQKREREVQYTASLDKFAVEKNLITRDEIIALENIKKQSSEDRVFAQWNKDFLEKNPGKTESDSKEHFRLFYSLDATDPYLKERGQQMLEEKANNILSSHQSKYDKAKEQFDAIQQDKARVPAFQAMLKSVVKEVAPEKITLVEGEGDEKITFDIDDKERLEIEKALVTDDVFDMFTSGSDAQQVQASLKEKAEALLFYRNRKAIIDAVKTAAYNRGTKNGSTTGATNPFPLNNGKNKPLEVADGITADDDAKLNRARGGRF